VKALPNRLEPTRQYLASKADLSASARIALRFVERGIKNDPDHRENRHEIVWPGVGSVVVDTSARGLLVAFHRISGGNRISLDEVVDLRHPPPWYSYPSVE
jgi:hypothetical protein